MSVREGELAIVKRIADDSLGYVNAGGRSLSFTADTIENYRGQSLAELGITEGATIRYVLDDLGRITQIFQVPESQDSDDEEPVLVGSRTPFEPPQAKDVSQKFYPLPPNNNQRELRPDSLAGGEIRPGRALPAKTRDFGRLIDISNLRAGDLLLTRDISGGNWISKTIVDVQNRIGYGPSDARWIHVAMYLGDGANVVEATIDSVMSGGSVRITHLDDYSDGTNILRFRRSKFIKQEQDGWRVCVCALSRLGKPYSIFGALKAWLQALIGNAVAYDSKQKTFLSGTVVCSTLYADSFNEALRLSLGEDNGICVPAWFSATNDFDDVDVQWLQIA